MATMDQNPDTPAETAPQKATGGATAYGSLFSHDADGKPAAQTAASGAVTGQVDSEGAEAAPKKATARRATAKKTAAKTTTAKTAAKASTAKKTTARKSTKAAAATESDEAAPATGTDASAEAEVSTQEDVEATDTTVDSADPAAAETDTETETADEDEAEEAAAAPAPASPFGLLFQAPDLSAVPARQPRRRAPAAPAQDAAPDSDSGTDSDSDANSDAAADSTSGGGSDSGTGTSSRSRSRRGRRPSTTGGDGETGEQTDATQESQSDSGDSNDSHDGPSSSDDSDDLSSRRRRRRGGKGRRGRGTLEDDTDSQDGSDSTDDSGQSDDSSDHGSDEESSTGTVRRRRRSNRRGEDGEARESRRAREEVTGVRGSTRLEAKRQRRREGREAGRRRTIITEAEFLARRESVERTMVVRGLPDRTQIGVLEDGVLVEHYVSRETQSTMVGNVYLGRVQNVLPSMEAAFVDIGKGRNAVLYAGEVNWDAAGLDNNAPKRIENALKSGDSVLVQVTKDPIGHKGARLTSQISLPGRYLVLVPGNSMTGISRKLPDTERARLKKILREVVPEGSGVIVRTAAEGASEDELRADVERLTGIWSRIEKKQKSVNAPALVHGEPDMTVRVIRDVFNEDFAKVVVAGEQAWTEVSDYIADVAPDLADRLEKWTGTQDVFTHYRVTEALTKAMDRKVWLPSGGSLVIDRTEAMTVVDVNTGKFVGSGGNLEETVTKNNIEAAEEIVRQLRLRDIGGIIVIDFIDMVLESNRDLVVRRLLECLGRDRTKHQVAEVTSLGLVQMTRKRVGAGLIEVFSEQCVHCNGRGIVVHSEPIEKSDHNGNGNGGGSSSSGGRRGRGRTGTPSNEPERPARPTPAPGGPTPAQIAAAAHAAAIASSGQATPAASGAPASPDATEAPSGETAVQGAAAAAASTAGASTPDVTTPDPATADATVGETPAPGIPAADVTDAAGSQDTASSPVGTAAAPTASRPRRGPRRGSAGAGAPASTQSTDSAPVPVTRPASEVAAESEPARSTDHAESAEPASTPEPQPAARRRRGRGRVVSPAGPPGGVPTETVDAAATESGAEPAAGSATEPTLESAGDRP